MIHRITWASLILLLGLPVIIFSFNGGCWSEKADEPTVMPPLLQQEPSSIDQDIPAPEAETSADTLLLRSPTRQGILQADPVSPQSDSFAFEMNMYGRISYFSGRFNHRGFWLPQDPRRFLGLEKIDFELQFNQPPYQIEVDLAGQVTLLAGHPGRTYYTFWLSMPEGPATLNWHNQRLSQPYTVKASATAWYDRTQSASSQIDGVELTGSIFQIVHVQPEASP